jgi:predicted Holliday junction resolvase-like endonuclease
MRLLILAILALYFTNSTAQVQVEKPIICMDTASLYKSLTSEELQEQIQWAGQSESNDSKYLLFVNKKTKTWTFVQLNEKIACILGTGEKSIFVDNFKTAKKQM